MWEPRVKSSAPKEKGWNQGAWWEKLYIASGTHCSSLSLERFDSQCSEVSIRIMPSWGCGGDEMLCVKANTRSLKAAWSLTFKFNLTEITKEINARVVFTPVSTVSRSCKMGITQWSHHIPPVILARAMSKCEVYGHEKDLLGVVARQAGWHLCPVTSFSCVERVERNLEAEQLA